jgi:hypothetical protein
MDLCSIAIQCKFNLTISTHLNQFWQEKESVTGRIIEVLAQSTGKYAVVILDLFTVLGSRHEILGMPMLARCQEEKTYAVIPSTVRVSPSLIFVYKIICTK